MFAKSFASTGWPAASAAPVVTPTSPSAIWLSLDFGAVFTPPSFLQLQSEPRRKAWRNTLGYAKPIRDDALAYATARMRLERRCGPRWRPPTKCSSATRLSCAIR